MAKLLEKIIQDAMDDKKCSLGAKEVIGSMKNSKLIILSQSIPKNTLQKIQETATSSKVPTLNFKGSSVELGRLCGTQFRISALSLKTLSETNVKILLKEVEEGIQQ